jgi:endonuclease I/V8-like Glu-specific endopeptidase
MKIDMQLREVIAETEARYTKRQTDRLQNQRKLNAGELLQADNPERVKKRLERLGMERSAATSLVEGFTVPLPASGTPLTLERILFKNDLMRINYLERGTLAGHAVGRLWIRSTNGQLVGYATGFMVSPRLLLTNQHVLPTRESAYGQVEFNYQDGIDGQPLQSVIFTLDPDTFFIADKALDYALVAVQAQSHIDLNRFGWHRLIEDEGKVIIGEYVSIIQHPGGEPKQVALRENQLVDVLPEFLHYQTDTAVGSSGSPVFNDQWEVVAVHHSGVPKRDRQGRILSIDGQVWTDDQGEQKIAWLANEGTRISCIIKHIKQQRLSRFAKPLRDELFEAIPDTTSRARSASNSDSFLDSVSNSDSKSSFASNSIPNSMSVSDSIDPVNSRSSVDPVMSSDGTVTWTIPIQVSIRLGQPTMQVDVVPAGATAISNQSSDISISNATSKTPTNSTKPATDELEAALAEFQEAAERTYYDEMQDQQDCDRYYGRLLSQIDSLEADELYRKLSDRLKQSHTNSLNYKPSKQLYPWVDLHPDLKIRSIYSGQSFEPEALIREDFRIDQLRSLRTQELQLKESTLSPDQYQQALELLEASLPYNCEHIVPQSWFGKAEPMRGDLHHLFACEVTCNSFRSNYPYFDFDQFQERDSIRDDCGKLSSDRFEPRKGKGAVARATLYFLLRYPGKISKTKSEYTIERLETLIGWHNAYPPTEYEQHRNAAIYERQGNRNPLIDFPQWAEQIDFSLGLG